MSRETLGSLEKNDLTCRIVRDTGLRHSINLYVDYPNFFTMEFIKENKTILDNIFEYSRREFSLRQLTNGESILEELKKYELDSFVDYQLVPYGSEDKKAVMHLYFDSRNGKFNPWDIKPAFYVDCGSFTQYTVFPGHFADYDVFKGNDGILMGHTKDFLFEACAMNSLFISLFMDNVEKYILGDGNMEDVKDSYENRYSNCSYGRDGDVEYCKVIDQITEQITEQTKKNSSVRINSLKIDGNTIIDEYLKDNDSSFISSMFISNTDCLYLSLKFGKKLKQVHDYLKKEIDKTRR